MTPACVMRITPNSPCRFVNAPDASTTPNVSYPSASAEMAGNVKHTSVEIPVTISCLRPVAFTASTTRFSVQALTVVLSIVGMPRTASASSGINGPHIFSVVVVTTTGIFNARSAWSTPRHCASVRVCRCLGHLWSAKTASRTGGREELFLTLPAKGRIAADGR